MSTSTNIVTPILPMTGKELQTVKYGFSGPFQLQLNDGQILFAQTIERLIPEKRMVVFGLLNNKPVVAKLFFGTGPLKHYMEKEIKGNKFLHTYKIPAPVIIYEGCSANKEVYVLVFERLMGAENAEKIWANRTSIEEVMPMLRTMVTELATQHVMGILQKDLHLKNFLIKDQIVYTLDSAQIETKSGMIPVDYCFQYLALFLAQLGIGVENEQQELFATYAKARSWLYSKKEMIRLFNLINKWNRKRWDSFKEKIFRDCTQFATYKNWRSTGMIDRQYTSPNFLNLLHNLDYAFHHPSAKLLKVGGGSTVVHINIDGRDLIIKRYNMKSISHFIRRCLRYTRARNFWIFSHKMRLFELPTAKPIAYIEQTFLGLRHQSYTISEWVPGFSANDYLMMQINHPEHMEKFIKNVSALINNLKKIFMTHGDLKLSNILINHYDRPVLIDLDGAIEHQHLSSLEHACKEDLHRFMQNFKYHPEIYERFKLELGAYTS